MIRDTEFDAYIGGLRFAGNPFDYAPGYWVEDVEGLLDGADETPQDIPLPGGDGVFDLPNDRTEPRIIGLSGFVYGSSMLDLGRRARALGALLRQSTEGAPFVWREFGEWFTVPVRRGRGSRIARLGDSRRADFTIRFRAASQRYFGETTTFEGSYVVAFHRGTFPAEPVVEVPGPHSGFTLYGPDGRTFTVTQSAPAGSVHTVSMRYGHVALDGVVQAGAASSAAVWAIPADVRVPMGIVGAPLMRVKVPDTFI